MGTAELKSNLRRLIDKVDDSKTLKIAYLVLSKNAEDREDWWNSLSKIEKTSIEEGLKDIDKGNVFSHSNVMKDLKAEFPGIFK